MSSRNTLAYFFHDEWAGPDSNRGPNDYESLALTAELPALLPEAGMVHDTRKLEMLLELIFSASEVRVHQETAVSKLGRVPIRQ